MGIFFISLTSWVTGSIVLGVTHNFTGLGVNVVVPLGSVFGVFQFDLINETTGAVFVQFCVVDGESRVLGQCLLVELFEIADSASLVQANDFIRADIGLGNSGSSGQSSGSEEGRDKFHDISFGLICFNGYVMR